jgi:hypothetical protein
MEEEEMQEKQGTFLTDTQKSLESCGKWLIENAGNLAEQLICDGCRDWSINFSAGEDGLFSFVNIEVDKLVLTQEYGVSK